MDSRLIRPPAAAGRFYPSAREALVATLVSFGEKGLPPASLYQDAVACVVPHAGYMYSGHVAFAVYSRLPACLRYVVLGPNHFGRGQQFATLSSDWQTPLGLVAVDAGLTTALLRENDFMADDRVSHADEHSLEVQLPFLQYLLQEFSFAPIAIGEAAYEDLVSLGVTLARLIEPTGPRTMLVASSDLNHYEPDAVTRIKDGLAIERILALDPRGLVKVIARERISMCGYAPVIAVLTAARELGATHGELVKYATSADAGGDPNAVVGYAGIVIR